MRDRVEDAGDRGQPAQQQQPPGPGAALAGKQRPEHGAQRQRGEQPEHEHPGQRQPAAGAADRQAGEQESAGEQHNRDHERYLPGEVDDLAKQVAEHAVRDGLGPQQRAVLPLDHDQVAHIDDSVIHDVQGEHADQRRGAQGEVRPRHVRVPGPDDHGEEDASRYQDRDQVTRRGRDDRDHHDRQDQAGGQQALAVPRVAMEEAEPGPVGDDLDDRRGDVVGDERPEGERPPQADDHAGDAGQQLDEPAYDARCPSGQPLHDRQRGSDRHRDRDDQGDRRGRQGAEDLRQRAELLAGQVGDAVGRYRRGVLRAEVPGRPGEDVPAGEPDRRDRLQHQRDQHEAEHEHRHHRATAA